MKAIKIFAAVLAAGLALSCSSQNNVKVDAELPTSAEVDSVSYLIGVNFGSFLKGNNFAEDLKEINMAEVKKGMVDFLNVFDGRLKTVLYCFDPIQISTVASVARAFSSKVKIGAPWWQCDNPIGMKRQLEYFGSVDLVNNCAGMVSDSRKLLSYGSRHEMFRRVLSDVLGNMAELGQAPEELLKDLAVRLCCEQPRSFFNI